MSVEVYPVKIIGHIRTDFTSKFGVPRQSGIVDALEARIEFEKESGDWRASPIYGSSGSFRKRYAATGLPRCDRPGWEATQEWVCLPPVRRFVQTPSGFLQ